LIDILTEEELLAVIGHELGHIKCNHQLYKTLAFILTKFGTELLNNLLPMGIGMVATMSIQLAVYHWYRMAEFSCDRAGLLVVQDPQVVAGALTKIAGYSQKIMSEVNLEAVIQQAGEYQNSDANVDKFMKLFMVMGRTHPLSVIRVKEIMEWEQSEEYQRILSGDYLTMAAEQKTARKSGQGRICSHCKTFVPDEAKFCFKCGALIPEVTPAQEKPCPACNTSNVAGAKFCFKCGTKIT
jgi:predicted Zn-dependent protease